VLRASVAVLEGSIAMALAEGLSYIGIWESGVRLLGIDRRSTAHAIAEVRAKAALERVKQLER
jgi:hypothetical protein